MSPPGARRAENRAAPKDVGYSYEQAPTLEAFAESDALVRGILGPVGSGKSSTCVWEAFRRGMAQEPGPDGVRRTRGAVVRNTKRELQDTTLKTWFEWFPPGVAGTWHKTDQTFWLRAHDEAGKLVMVSEVLFRAMDIPKQVRDVLSLELTWAWLNEARELEEAIFRALLNKGRLGRYPSRRNAGIGATWHGLWMDTNPPDDLSWWYRVFEEDEIDNPAYQLFKQPGGRTAQAENIPNLPPGYYEDAANGASDQYIKVYIDAQYGTVEEGKPIYKGQYNDRLHVSDVELWPIKRVPIALGFDWGLTPAVVIIQITPRGQLRVIDEVVGTNMGVQQFIRGAVKPLLATKYKGFEIEESIGDPSGEGRKDTDERSPFDVVHSEGLPIRAAPSNDPKQRWEWVRYWLTALRDGQPAFLLSPTCKYLRRGFNGRYKLRRLQVSGPDVRYTEKADKNDASHPHDALQYICSAYVPENLLPALPAKQNFRAADRVAGY